jgi:hypothetical protein
MMITDHVPAVGVPLDHAASRVAAAVPARRYVEDRRNLDPAPPARRPTAPSGAPTDRTLIWNQNHLRRILRQYKTHHNQHRPHRSLHGAAPLKPLPETVDLEQYRIRRRARVAGLINEYRLVA